MSPRDQLKAATRRAHERVDQRYSEFDLADAGHYRRFLIAHQAVLPACEQLLTRSGAVRLLADWPLRLRTPALLADLATVGASPVPAAHTIAPLSPAAAFGMLYVTEGSRLGGAVLAQRVLHNADARCRAATRYLRHGEGRRFWPSFLATFETALDLIGPLDLVIASALGTFELFEAAATPPSAAA